MKVALSHIHIHKAKNSVLCRVKTWAEPTHSGKLMLTNFDMDIFHAVLIYHVTLTVKTVSLQKLVALFFSRCDSFALVILIALELQVF